ncbi:nucleotidyltransferase domain-containing protein [Candidatus Pacearchaeota archaeon]|nr:nucleotidyltransferase domain-containing protein [Candidatus Pacearchaeota archaeon]
MIQKCSLMNVAEVFFKEPTKVHFIKEISRKIKLAPTSVRVHIKTLKKEGIIIKKEASPFNGLVANLDSSKFIFYKRASNLFSLFNLREAIINSIAPSAIILFGSYSMGEDTEDSDIDFIVLRKTKKEINIQEFEKSLNRKIHITYLNNINELDVNVKENAKRGVIIYGGY